MRSSNFEKKNNLTSLFVSKLDSVISHLLKCYVVCISLLFQINRSKNKWKFHLKDGIMNVNGKDQLFMKATGDAEW